MFFSTSSWTFNFQPLEFNYHNMKATSVLADFVCNSQIERWLTCRTSFANLFADSLSCVFRNLFRFISSPLFSSSSSFYSSLSSSSPSSFSSSFWRGYVFPCSLLVSRILFIYWIHTFYHICVSGMILDICGLSICFLKDFFCRVKVFFILMSLTYHFLFMDHACGIVSKNALPYPE